MFKDIFYICRKKPEAKQNCHQVTNAKETDRVATSALWCQSSKCRLVVCTASNSWLSRTTTYL